MIILKPKKLPENQCPNCMYPMPGMDREKKPENDDHEGVVDQFCAQAETRGFLVMRDKTQVGYRNSIGHFMRDIGAAGKVIVSG